MTGISMDQALISLQTARPERPGNIRSRTTVAGRSGLTGSEAGRTFALNLNFVALRRELSLQRTLDAWIVFDDENKAHVHSPGWFNLGPVPDLFGALH